MAQYLYQAGHRIVLGSRKARSSPDWLPKAEVVHTDWNDSVILKQICSGIDVVIHAAGMNAQDCAADPTAALEFNGLGTARLVEAAYGAGVKRFIYLSTAHVYSSPLVGAIAEDACPRNLHPYATSHIAGENVVLSARQHGKIEGVVLRLSNAFGVPVNIGANCWMLLVNDLCRQVVETGRIRLQSSGIQQRDFVTLHDVSRVVGHLLDLRNEDLQDGLFNVGGGCSLTVFEMARRIAKCSMAELGFEPNIERPEPEKSEQTVAFGYDIKKLKKTGFSISGDVDTEILRTLKICAQHKRCPL